MQAAGQPPWVVTLPRDVWLTCESAHHQRVAPLTESCRQRRSLGQKHPVWDFLFTYYSFPPRKLLTWVPGIVDDEGRLRVPAIPCTGSESTQSWTAPALPERSRRVAREIADLCHRILERPARYTCYGLHEWAMVYRLSPEAVRHASTPLRLHLETVNNFVRSQSLAQKARPLRERLRRTALSLATYPAGDSPSPFPSSSSSPAHSSP